MTIFSGKWLHNAAGFFWLWQGEISLEDIARTRCLFRRRLRALSIQNWHQVHPQALLSAYATIVQSSCYV